MPDHRDTKKDRTGGWLRGAALHEFAEFESRQTCQPRQLLRDFRIFLRDVRGLFPIVAQVIEDGLL